VKPPIDLARHPARLFSHVGVIGTETRAGQQTGGQNRKSEQRILHDPWSFAKKTNQI
jgi:hypothetical protein